MPSAPDDVARLMRRIEDDVKRLGVLVEDLLTLARLDERRPLGLAPVDLAVIADDAVHDAAAVQRHRRVTLDAARSVVVPGDEARPRQVLTNLLPNADQLAPVDAAVRLRVCRRGDDAVLEDEPGRWEIATNGLLPAVPDPRAASTP